MTKPDYPIDWLAISMVALMAVGVGLIVGALMVAMMQ